MAINARAFVGGNIFIAGVGRLGEIVDLTLPKIENNTIETSAGIGKAELVIPTLKPLTVSFTVNNYSEVYFDLLNTLEPHEFYLRSSLASYGKSESLVATFKGKIKSLDAGKFEFDKEAQVAVEMSVIFYKLEKDGASMINYDFENNSYKVNGKEIYADIRKHISV